MVLPEIFKEELYGLFVIRHHASNNGGHIVCIHPGEAESSLAREVLRNVLPLVEDHSYARFLLDKMPEFYSRDSEIIKPAKTATCIAVPSDIVLYLSTHDANAVPHLITQQRLTIDFYLLSGRL